MRRVQAVPGDVAQPDHAQADWLRHASSCTLAGDVDRYENRFSRMIVASRSVSVKLAGTWFSRDAARATPSVIDDMRKVRDMGASLDTSFLPPADLAFVVMTDTHHMLDPGHAADRVRIAAAPGRPGGACPRPRRRARAGLRRSPWRPRAGVPGRSRVRGSPWRRPCPVRRRRSDVRIRWPATTMLGTSQIRPCRPSGPPRPPWTPTTERFGPSWTSWNAAGCHFVILNSQIMNGPLAAAGEQERWLEADLAAHGEMPTFLFQHLSPFLVDEHEPGLGHYDNVDEPARTWLLGLIRRHNVQMIFAGHSHFAVLQPDRRRPFVARALHRLHPARILRGLLQRAAARSAAATTPPNSASSSCACTIAQARVHLIRTGGAIADPAGAARHAPGS